MMYYDYLCALLEPMRIYRTGRGSISGGELYAAGAALDGAQKKLDHAERESILPLAEDEGLSRREKLFSRCPVRASTALRREAAAALARIACPGDLILTVGAGDIFKAGEKLLKEEK